MLVQHGQISLALLKLNDSVNIYNFLGEFMELKQNLILESVKGDFNFAFHMPTGATWGNAIDAAFEVLQKLNELSLQSIQAANPNPAVEPVEPEVVVQGD